VSAGEQRKRDYDWSKAKIDPKQHRFGRVDSKGQQSSMKQVSVRKLGPCCCGMAHFDRTAPRLPFDTFLYL
jgi:hypothetical protein